MKYLLDTLVVLWMAENSPHLSGRARQVILDTESEKFVSIVSVWEVAIKLGTQKLRLEGGLAEFFRNTRCRGYGNGLENWPPHAFSRNLL